MYAVIQTGGKQYRVSEGQQLQIERSGQEPDGELQLRPVLLVDGETVVTGDALGKASVTAKVIGPSKGPKITGFTYKNKSNQRRRWGHRQQYDTIEITGIEKG
jgi:large subunit ribosomal protein L21